MFEPQMPAPEVAKESEMPGPMETASEGAIEEENPQVAQPVIEKIEIAEKAIPDQKGIEVDRSDLEAKKEKLVEKFVEAAMIAHDPVAEAERIFDNARSKYLGKYPDLVKKMHIEMIKRMDESFEASRHERGMG